jgi:hypothetical protein
MWFAVGLFILLSPGILITLPSFSFLSEETSFLAVALHALVFAACLEAVRRYSLTELIEGFTDSVPVEGWRLEDGNGCGNQICRYDKPVCRANSDGARFCSES